MISITIPTFNRQAALARAIQSVLDQTFRNWELIVVDDGSSDESWRTLQQFQDERIRYVYQGHRGASSARNTGVRLARFSWLCFLDSDDYWLPDKLQRQIEEVTAHPGYRLNYTDEIWIRRGKRVNPRKIHQKHGGWIYHRCLPLCIISPSSVMIHRRILEQEGLFNEALPVCEDYELWLRICCRHPVLFTAEPLIVKTGGHSDQLSRSVWGMDQYRLKGLAGLLSSGRLTPQQEVWTTRELIRKAGIVAAGCAKRGKSEEANRYKEMIRAYG